MRVTVWNEGRHEIKIDKYIPSAITCIANIVGDMVLVATERKEGYELVLYGQIYRLIGLVLANNLYTENSGGKVSNKSSVNARSRALIKSVIEYIEEPFLGKIRSWSCLVSLGRKDGLSFKFTTDDSHLDQRLKLLDITEVPIQGHFLITLQRGTETYCRDLRIKLKVLHRKKYKILCCSKIRSLE